MTFGLCRICDPVGWSRGLSGASDAQKPALRDRWHFPDRDIDIPQDKLFTRYSTETQYREIGSNPDGFSCHSQDLQPGYRLDEGGFSSVCWRNDKRSFSSSNWIEIHVLETCRKAWNKSLIFLIMKIRLYLLEYIWIEWMKLICSEMV